MLKKSFRKSVAFKLICNVSGAMAVVLLLQVYINVTHFEKLVTPLIYRDLDSALARSKIVFDSIFKQTVGDAKVLSSHNAMSGYLNFEQLGDQQGRNNELVELEQFLNSFIHSKPHYRTIEVFTHQGSAIRLVDGNVTESNVSTLPSALINNTLNSRSNYVQGSSKDNDKLLRQDTLFSLEYSFSAGDAFTNNVDVSGVIYIQRKVDQELQELIRELKAINMHLMLTSNNVVIAGEPLDQNWLVRDIHYFQSNISIAVGISKADAFLFVDEMRIRTIFLAITLILVVALSQFIVINRIVARPLKHINKFMVKYALGSHLSSVRHPSKNNDEIGLFAKGLNNLLDQIQYRQDALSASEEKLSLALWGSGEGMWEFCGQRSALSFSQESCEILAIDENSVPLSEVEFFARVHNEDKTMVEAYFKNFIK